MKKLISAIFTLIIIQFGIVQPALAADSPPAQSTVEQAQSSPININTASETQLRSLPGIGASKAKAIVEYRETFGEFASVDSITKVKGIGNKLLAKFRDNIEV